MFDATVGVSRQRTPSPTTPAVSTGRGTKPALDRRAQRSNTRLQLRMGVFRRATRLVCKLNPSQTPVISALQRARAPLTLQPFFEYRRQQL